VILLDSHMAALRAHAYRAAEDTDNDHGWAHGFYVPDGEWTWDHLHELRDAGLIEWRDEWKHILIRPTDAGWELLNDPPPVGRHAP
jgi:hypothetical protein